MHHQNHWGYKQGRFCKVVSHKLLCSAQDIKHLEQTCPWAALKYLWLEGVLSYQTCSWSLLLHPFLTSDPHSTFLNLFPSPFPNFSQGLLVVNEVGSSKECPTLFRSYDWWAHLQRLFSPRSESWISDYAALPKSQTIFQVHLLELCSSG